MKNISISQKIYKELASGQERLFDEVKEIKKKLRLLNLTEEFETLAKWGRQYARRNKIKIKDVLEND